MAIHHAAPPSAPIHGRQGLMPHANVAICDDALAQRAAALARAAFPDSLPPDDIRSGRNEFIMHKRWELFDQNHDGFLEFEEYLSSEWAGYLVHAPAGSCVVSKNAVMKRFLGYPGTKVGGWKIPDQVQLIETLYRSMDYSGRGYLIKDDIRSRARAAFSFSDKNQDGKLSRSEFK